jgi:L-threonylcarbamoyladenylate synthase
MTKILTVNALNPNYEVLSEAAYALSRGKLCAFPTETVYGLGANALLRDAAMKIYAAKGRPADNPLIVHIADKEDVYYICSNVPESAEILMEQFWGGPLTLIMNKSDKIPYSVTAGLETVAVRLPSHPVANALIKLCGFPIAAPSANISGKPSPTIARHVIDDLYGRVDYIIDGGSCFYGLESTVLDLTADTPAILRPGAVTAEELELVLGGITFGGENGTVKSPGTKYKHYAPKAPLFVVEGDAPSIINKTDSKCYNKAGVLNYGYNSESFPGKTVLSAGSTPSEYAARLFYILREFDNLAVDVIYAVPPESGEIGDAVLNRLYKAAGGKVIK